MQNHGSPLAVPLVGIRRLVLRVPLSSIHAPRQPLVPGPPSPKKARTCGLECTDSLSSHTRFQTPGFPHREEYLNGRACLCMQPGHAFRSLTAFSTRTRGFLAAETGRPLPLSSRPLMQTHGAWPKGSTLPWTMQNATLGARGASPREVAQVAHAERQWHMHGGKTSPPQRQRRRS